MPDRSQQRPAQRPAVQGASARSFAHSHGSAPARGVAPAHGVSSSRGATSTHASARGRHAQTTKRKQGGMPKALKVLLIVVIVALLGVGCFFAWNQWFRYDDRADIQGQWKIEGSTNSIVITDSEIRLTDSVTFTYELDTFTKTVKYEYASFTGNGSYAFSPERDVLTFTDVGLSPDEGDSQQSMSLLKVSNRATGEPQSANNNTTEDAQTYGSAVVSGTMTPDQAKQSDHLSEDIDPDE